MIPHGTDAWSAVHYSLRGVPQQDVRLPADAVLSEGTVVILARFGQPRGYGLRGPHVVMAGVLVAVSELAARDLLDPARAAERRYADACAAAGLPEQETR